MLALICEVYLQARREDRLVPSQVATARTTEILLSGLARVGIVALVDEATGYQETRSKRELRMILENYVSVELRPWGKTFPNEFFEQFCRLNGCHFRPGTSKRTPQVDKLINSYIYGRLPPGVHDELRRRNPRTPKGYRVHKHHQFLANTGNEHLNKTCSSERSRRRNCGCRLSSKRRRNPRAPTEHRAVILADHRRHHAPRQPLK